MGLKAIVEKLEDVPEVFRELYTQKGTKFEITGVEGIKTQADIDRLQGALTKERGDHKAVKDRLALLGDRKIEDVVTLLDRIPELEAAASGKGVDEKKLEELVEGRIKTKLAPVEREKGKLAQQVQELTGVVEQYKTKETTRSIHDAVRDAVGKAQGFQPSAAEDALLYAERMFEIQDGRVVTRDGVGVTPGVDATVWLTEMQPKKPHWYGPSQGGGAAGNRTGAGGGANPWTHEAWNLTEQGKILRENSTRAEQLAKSAGTSIGGMKPAPRK
jgi:hypothetical protein